jgi:hypothetical protein
MKWKKQSIGWPPDDPPKGNGTTIKGIETFGDREKKSYNDSLRLYNYSIQAGTDITNALADGYDKDYDPTIRAKMHKKNVKFYTNTLVTPQYTFKEPKFGTITPFGQKEKEDLYFFKKLNEDMLANNDYIMGMAVSSENGAKTELKYTNQFINNLKNPIKPVLYLRSAELPGIPLYKKPTGNGLQPQLSKVPIIKPEQQSSLIKFRPPTPTPLPKGNQDLPFGNYTQIGMKIKPDGTKFIYDRLGRTDKTVVISDPRIGIEYYIDDLFKDVKKDTPIYKK